MIPSIFRPSPAASPYWHANRGHWVPAHRRVKPPARWLRYPLATILVASGIWFAPPLWPADAGAVAEAEVVLGPCHARAGASGVALFAERDNSDD